MKTAEVKELNLLQRDSSKIDSSEITIATGINKKRILE